MARRKRKRRGPPPPRKDPAGSGESPNPPAPDAKPRSRRSDAKDERPPAPWGSFPLVELMVLTGLVLVVVGFIRSGYQGTVMVGGGLALGSLAGLELSVREHLAGYKSHTLMLAGVAAVATITALFLFAQDLAPLVRLGAGVAVFALAALGLRRIFRHRSGGVAFRL